MQRQYDVARLMVEAKLKTYFAEAVPQEKLFEAMRYSLLAGGKRIRPVITLKFAEAVGGSMEKALPAACALEMVHTYSLIHDDLPCMDDDILRRGKPTNHVIYGECTATLAGDALQAAAFETILSTDLPAETVLTMAQVLAHAAGEHGICGGQLLDMAGEHRQQTETELNRIHAMKTAAMLKAAAEIGVICGGGTAEQRRGAEQYAEALGLAFQIRDDILDQTATTEALGKPVGSDAGREKYTFAALYGVARCEALVLEKTEAAKAAITGAFENTEFFCWLADQLARRMY